MFSELKSAEIDMTSASAIVGAGLNQLEAVTALGEEGPRGDHRNGRQRTPPGATLGGGFGFLTRDLGMACDSLVGGLKVVASDDDCAKVVKADLRNNSDLLWALRGAENGNFGIVTSLTYKASPLKSVAYVRRSGTGLGDLHGVFDTWQRMAPVADDWLGTQVEIHEGEILLFAVLAEGIRAEGEGNCWP